MKSTWLIALLTLLTPLSAISQTADNQRRARELFDKTYQMVFGPNGSSLHYKVNIIGIYKTEGDIWYKGKKSKFDSNKSTAWNDGTTTYILEKKKHLVEIHNTSSNKKDKYADKFKFYPENFVYSMENQTDGILLTLKAKKGAKGIKEIRALVDRKTLVPLKVRIKAFFVWTTIHISNFSNQGVSDNLFVFPKNQFKDFKMVDKR